MQPTTRVFVSPDASTAPPSRTYHFHFRPGCAERSHYNPDLIHLEKAIKEGYRPCGICASDVTQERIDTFENQLRLKKFEKQL